MATMQSTFMRASLWVKMFLGFIVCFLLAALFNTLGYTSFMFAFVAIGVVCCVWAIVSACNP